MGKIDMRLTTSKRNEAQYSCIIREIFLAYHGSPTWLPTTNSIIQIFLTEYTNINKDTVVTSWQRYNLTIVLPNCDVVGLWFTPLFLARHPYAYELTSIRSQGLYSLSHKTTYRQISLRRNARCGFTHWDRDKLSGILQTTFWNAFLWMKMHEFRLKFD